MGDGTLKEPHSYVKKGDRLQLRISRLEPERRRVGFTQRWGTDAPEGEEGSIEGAIEAAPETAAEFVASDVESEAQDTPAPVVDEAVVEEVEEVSDNNAENDDPSTEES